MIIGSGITVGSGVSIVPDITYTAGLFKTTYSGYFNDVATAVAFKPFET